MQSGLGMVTETTQNVYDELKAKKTPGDNWFGFAFFLGWSHIPAPHLKGRNSNERLFGLLYYKYKIIYTELQKEFGMLWNSLAWKIWMCVGGRNKKQRKGVESLGAEGWHKSVRKQVHPLKAALVQKIWAALEALWRPWEERQIFIPFSFYHLF